MWYSAGIMKLRNVARYHAARDVEEALSLLAAYDGRGAVLAGGVDLARYPRTDIEGLIDVTGAGLGWVRQRDGGLSVGATTSLTELLEAPLAHGYLRGIVAEVLRRVAVLPLRNMATLGGAVVSAHPWADIPTLLVALGVQVRWAGVREEVGEIEEVYAGPFRERFRNAVVTEVVFPPWDGGFAFEKLGRSTYDIALINTVCGVGLSDGAIAWARMAVGATPGRGRRLPWLEAELVGQVPSQALWKRVASEVAEKVDTDTDRRADGDWRRHALGALVGRALARAAARAGDVGG